jgi:phospholipid-binding lipoprotein MlaA
LEPVAKGYRKATPEAGRIVVRNFLRNLNSPTIIGNELLQGDLKGAGNATARVVINTLAGFGGILDLAEQGGIEYQPEDFGQTLAKWGVGDGMYIMIPLLGPSSLRDASGQLVDSYADPLRMYLFNIDEEHLHYTRVAASVVSKREELIEVIDDLRRNSFDYYAAVRSAYYQHRQALINDQSGATSPEIPEYDDF